ncbi:hypothetical protein [Silanimonas sp.]|jgi:hypothetical protein|uniref:hypothetical protein n=1 Tax=Silanimonas sp. TaxID=1929290 RepID=UPI0022BA91E6|nr:hypothetical protein [Silanimonas sp.]MCZ8062000.1 hypothetical protein [Silanimonas sp.]
MSAAWQSLHGQWRANRRLRIAVGLALLVAVLHAAIALSEARGARIERYLQDRSLLGRLEGAAADAAWTGRATEARDALATMEATMTAAASAGEAQAELQALLSALAATAGLDQPRVRSEAALDVEGVPDLWQVVARLDAGATPSAIDSALRDLAQRPWLRVERIEIRDGSPATVQLIVRGYLRKAGEGE